MIRFLMPAVFVALLLNPPAATAQDQRQDMPGQFDFFVLSLSWSPSFCAAAAERGRGRAANAQCGVRPYSFVVHGLWPQYAIAPGDRPGLALMNAFSTSRGVTLSGS
jgi:ribonuclease T2